MSGQYIASIFASHVTLIATLIIIFAGSLAAGLAGFAFSAVTGAVLFHLLAPIDAVPLLLACSITTQLFSISKLWHTMQWKQCFPYLVGGFAGIPIGAQLLKTFDAHTFAVGFGLFLMLSAHGIYLHRERTPPGAAADGHVRRSRPPAAQRAGGDIFRHVSEGAAEPACRVH